jgi:exopolysaccharide biosynthesis polyprenyl glycosylphosphotransferase
MVIFYSRFASNAFSRLLGEDAPGLANVRSLSEYEIVLVIYAALILFFFEYYDLYRTARNRTSLEESQIVGKVVVLVTMLMATCMYALKIQVVSRLVFGVSGIMNLLALAGWRYWKRQVVNGRIERGKGVRNILIVTAGSSGLELARILSENKQLGYVVRGFIAENGLRAPNVLGKIDDLRRAAQENFIDEIFIAPPLDREVVKRVALAAHQSRLDVKLVPDLYDGLALGAPVDQLYGLPVLTLHEEPIPAGALLTKRVLDIALSGVGLLMSSPVLALIAIGIKLDSTGPVLYRAKRVGKKGSNFVCYKFRTMLPNADALKDQLRKLNQREGPTFKIANDPRLTRLGKFLRKYSLDELPQLWNILKGEMSLVGPRPHPVDDFERYTHEHLRRLDVTPGLTGLWQVNARDDPSFDTNMALDLEYIERWNPWMDIRILLKTVPAVFRGAGQ